MGNVFKKTVTRPLPTGAEIITRQGVRLARWRDGKGKTKTSPVTAGQSGAERIRDESGTYVARYRDGYGHVVEVSTKCRDQAAAQSVLADLERRAEKVRSKILTSAEDRIADHLPTPLRAHVAAYSTHLEANELATLTVSQLRLDGRVAFAELAAADEKNCEGNSIPIRDDLAADLRSWLGDKLAALQTEARRDGEPIPSRLPAETRLFIVPKELVKILNRDLKLAGISMTGAERSMSTLCERHSARY
jgi:hypothetical protein